MLSLALVIFLIVLLTQTIAWVGKSVLQELCFGLYSRLFLAGSAARQRKLRKQVLEDKTALAKTSSQDEFAKWAKLRRKVDKGLADLEAINSTLGSSRTAFGLKFSSAIWVLTTGSQLVVVWWYRKQPVFWLPRGWVPAAVEWVLSLPSAPRGAVSSGAWCAVCKRVLVTLGEIARELTTPVAPAPTRVPVGVPEKQGATIEPLGIEHDKLD